MATAIAGASIGVSAGLAAETRAFTPLLEDCRCGREVGRLLESWGATGEILRSPPGIDGKERFRLATAEIGVWITLEPGPDRGSPVLYRTRPGGGERIELSEECGAEERGETPGVAETAEGFTDRDLTIELAKNRRLVVFLWSPHMPLSVDGLPEIEVAARAVGASLVAVTDPSSDRRFVDEISRERGIPPESLRPLASVELLFRDLAVHAPSILAFDERRVSAPLPGYRNRRDYTRFLETFFSRSAPRPERMKRQKVR
jgi:hypothetical protein